MSNNDKQIQTKKTLLPANLPEGAVAFQAAVDGKLTKEVWDLILDSQIKKAKEGDRGAARFLLEYAGGVASMRGATFVQETHNHEHFHEATNGKPVPTGAIARLSDPRDVPERTPADFDQARERRARVAASKASELNR